ncbi:MAG TPA: acyl carrier protein [Acidobacteriaceae bacterium]|jgi:acyl carrier protein|nr:acyl carrier protein [Acidobacteriaceae bacterium]
MSDEQVPRSLRELLADIFEISPEQVTSELSMETADNWDSFRHLQAILALEGEYGVQLDPQRIPELTSVALLQAELLKKGAVL